MERGIKKIEWVEGKIEPKFSIPNSRVAIIAEQFVFFKVSEWFEHTSQEDKQKDVVWRLTTENQRHTILEKTLPHDKKYGIKLPKNLCGPYHYYLSANLVDNKNHTGNGLYIIGHCKPKVTNIKWCIKNDSEDVSKTNIFAYGNPVYLNIETEGLNGYKNLIIDIYRKTGNKLLKVYTNAEVIDGEINIPITDTFLWQGKIMFEQSNPIQEVEEFYIKVKNPASGDYIESSQVAYLKIKNEVQITPPKAPNNITPYKVGKPKQNLKNYQPCKFAKIEITNKSEHDVIFDEGKFIKKLSPQDNTIVTHQIHYDYDKWDIRPDDKPTLNEIAKFLMSPPYLPVELGSHTDSRGTNEYNMELSLKRAKSVVDYLIQQGVAPERISARGYGETKLINTGEDISEDLHQQNRRTTLRFNVFQNNAQTLVHDVIVPSVHMPTTLSIDIRGLATNQCFQKEKHKNGIIILNSYKQATKFPLQAKKSKDDKGDTTISYEVASLPPNIHELIQAFVYYKTNVYSFYINSCAYYSKNDHPTFIVNAYPDVNWILHLRYNFATAPFFKDIPVHLVTGIRMLNQIKASIQNFIKDISFLSDDKKENANNIAEMLTELPDSFQVGMHALYDFSEPKTPTRHIDYTEEYKYLAEIYIAELCIGVILVELLIIWFTKGKGAFGRLRKVRKVAKALKKMDELGFEFSDPKVAYASGIYFEKQKDGRIAHVSVTTIKAEPLLGIEYHKEHKLSELAKKDESLEGLIKELGITATVKLDFEGKIEADYKVKTNSLIKTVSIKDNLNNHLSNDLGVFIGGGVILAKAKVYVHGKLEKDVTIIPFTKPAKITIEAELTADLGGYLSLSSQYGLVKSQLFHQDTIQFSGIKGTYKQKMRISAGDWDLDSNPTNKTVPFVLFEPHTIKTGKAIAFNI